jgi:RNA-directed DNA polymerase
MTNQTQKTNQFLLQRGPLKSLRDLQYRLGVDREKLVTLARAFNDSYSHFDQVADPKPHAKRIKASKIRRIDNPCESLKAVQTRILDRLLRPVMLPHFLFGGIRTRSISSHAREHCSAKTVVKMDIRSYYPSLTNRHVFYVWKDVLLCSPRLARLLTKLTTFDGHLPQGAPTSPAIANFFLASIYSPILQSCETKGVTATAWVDDLIFSGSNARAVMEQVRRALAANGLRLSSKKTFILNAQNVKVITGARLGENGLRARKETLREIRAGIHNLRCGRFTSLGREKDIEKLRGRIAFVRSLCSADAIPLAAALDRLEQIMTKQGFRCPFTRGLSFPPFP